MLPSSQIDYSIKAPNAPKYVWQAAIPDGNAQTFTMTTAGGGSVTIQVPAVVVNFARSRLEFTFAPAADVAGLFNWIFADTVPQIQRILVYGKGNVQICDLNEVANYLTVVGPPETKYSDLQQYPTPGQYGVSGGGAASGASWFDVSYGLCPSRFAPASNPRHNYDEATANSPNSLSTGTSFGEPQYFFRPKGATGADTASPVINYSIPLSMFKNTILALDKDLYFGDIIYFKVFFHPFTKCGSKSDSKDDVGGAAALGGATLSNIQLMVAE